MSEKLVKTIDYWTRRLDELSEALDRALDANDEAVWNYLVEQEDIALDKLDKLEKK